MMECTAANKGSSSHNCTSGSAATDSDGRSSDRDCYGSDPACTSKTAISNGNHHNDGALDPTLCGISPAYGFILEKPVVSAVTLHHEYCHVTSRVLSRYITSTVPLHDVHDKSALLRH